MIANRSQAGSLVYGTRQIAQQSDRGPNYARRSEAIDWDRTRALKVRQPNAVQEPASPTLEVVTAMQASLAAGFDRIEMALNRLIELIEPASDQECEVDAEVVIGAVRAALQDADLIGLDADDIAQSIGLPIGQVIEALDTLEAQGHVRPAS